MKFIADTSKTLNECIDKKEIQKNVNKIDFQSVHYLELMISENIIMNYEDIKKAISDSRKKYIEEELGKLQKKTKIFNERIQIRKQREKYAEIER